MRFTHFLSAILIYCALSHSDETPTFDQLETRLSTLEKKARSQEHYNPGAAPASGFLLGGDVLYWQARENGIPYAIQIKNPQEVEPPDTVKSHVKELQYDWDFGVRVHGGYQCRRDDWMLLATWTHFDTKAQDTGFNNGSKRYNPIWAAPDFTQPPDTAIQAKAKWKLFINQVDLSLARPFYTGKYFILQPEAGLSGVWIDQHLRLRYTRDGIPGFSHVKLENDFYAGGIRAGLDTRFCFCKGWSIFNMTHFGLYYGKFELERKEKFITDNLLSQTLKDSLKNSYRQISPLIQMQMGVRWERGFYNNRYAVALKLAYEYQIYFSQNQFMKIINNDPFPQVVENQGDLCLTGGTFSVLFTF